MIDNEKLIEAMGELSKLGITLQDIQLQGVSTCGRVEELVILGVEFDFETITKDELLDLWYILGWSDNRIAKEFGKKQGAVTKKRKLFGITDNTCLFLVIEKALREYK